MNKNGILDVKMELPNLKKIAEERKEFCLIALDNFDINHYKTIKECGEAQSRWQSALFNWCELLMYINGSLQPNNKIVSIIQNTIIELKNYNSLELYKIMNAEPIFNNKSYMDMVCRFEESIKTMDLAIEEAKVRWSYWLC
jgi:hypothetical protein